MIQKWKWKNYSTLIRTSATGTTIWNLHLRKNAMNLWMEYAMEILLWKPGTHHHHLQHHDHKNNDFSHEGHFHSNKQAGHTSNGSLNPEVKMEDIKLIKNDPLVCKWNECTTQIDSDGLDTHLFKNYLQFLFLCLQVVMVKILMTRE